MGAESTSPSHGGSGIGSSPRSGRQPPRSLTSVTRPGSALEPFDAVVIGGGHNGLVAAGLLAKQGARVVVLERRDVVGGAAITEQPWGPEYKMTALSYVVSLMPPTILEELQLERHGYRVFPQHDYFVPYRDGGYLQLTPERIRHFSPRDAEAFPKWNAWLTGLADVLGPLLS